MQPSIGQDATTPQRSGCAGTALAIVGALLSILYLANLTFGVLEIPDNLPLIGNIDEVMASGILFACLSRLGINPVPNFRRTSQPAKASAKTK